MDQAKIDSIRDLLADHLERALQGDEDTKVSDSVLRSASTFLRLYDPKHKPRKTVDEEVDLVRSAAPRVGGRVTAPPFSSLDQEIEQS